MGSPIEVTFVGAVLTVISVLGLPGPSGMRTVVQAGITGNE